jgi:hypothetical protein
MHEILSNLDKTVVDSFISIKTELAKLAYTFESNATDLLVEMKIYADELKNISSNVEKNLNISEKNLKVSENIYSKMVELSNEVKNNNKKMNLEECFDFKSSQQNVYVDSDHDDVVIGEGSFGKVLKMKFLLDNKF